MGDFNLDYAADASSRDAGYDLMTANGVWAWVKPVTLVTTQCSGWPCAFDSVLDFVFVVGAAQAWPASAEIVVRAGDFPDDATTSDHRPVRATFSLPGSPRRQVWLLAVVKPPAAPGTDPICSVDTYSCSDFAIQPEAQAVFDYCWSQGAGDIHGLDSNSDGVACENLPPGFIVVR